MRRIDSHLHLWDRRRFDYGWMAGRALPETSLPTEFAEVWGGARAAEAGPAPESGAAGGSLNAAAVVIEAGVDAGLRTAERKWIGGLIREHPFLLGFVAAADLAAAGEAQVEACAEDSAVVGIRDNFEGLPAGALTERSAAAEARFRGLLRARDAGLSVDLCVRAAQLSEMHALLERIAAVRGDLDGFVLDHLGKPLPEQWADGGDGRQSPHPDRLQWQEDIAALAALPGLRLKVSGLGGQLSGTASEAELERLVLEYAVPAVRAFGAERSMVGSDHPVSTLPCGITQEQWVRTVERTLRGEFGEAAEQTLGAVAEHHYGLGSEDRSTRGERRW
ncbi:amidohydrolase family protein [Brevibacterium salitolerans]|uniref:Amidohydrolase family protein n=1 Tax=Brevibacterium salitolerans TaxID=1403566 RepID=A0ABP5I580_9MICO